MQPADDNVVSSIAEDVMKCLVRSGYFEKLDDLLSPQDDLGPQQNCNGSYKLSEEVLLPCGFVQGDLQDIFAVLQSKGGCCDCEVLYNVLETSRLKQSIGAVAQQVNRPVRLTRSRISTGSKSGDNPVSQELTSSGLYLFASAGII